MNNTIRDTNLRMERAAEGLLTYMLKCEEDRVAPSYFSLEALEVSFALVQFRRVHNIESSNPKLRKE